jgi:hypothetical protein
VADVSVDGVDGAHAPNPRPSDSTSAALRLRAVVVLIAYLIIVGGFLTQVAVREAARIPSCTRFAKTAPVSAIAVTPVVVEIRRESRKFWRDSTTG